MHNDKPVDIITGRHAQSAKPDKKAFANAVADPFPVYRRAQHRGPGHPPPKSEGDSQTQKGSGQPTGQNHIDGAQRGHGHPDPYDGKNPQGGTDEKQHIGQKRTAQGNDIAVNNSRIALYDGKCENIKDRPLIARIAPIHDDHRDQNDKQNDVIEEIENGLIAHPAQGFQRCDANEIARHDVIQTNAQKGRGDHDHAKNQAVRAHVRQT